MAADKPKPGNPPSPEDAIPKTPPPALRGLYLGISRSYLYWCLGMLGWSVLCMLYFILTRQRLEMIIGLCLGLLMISLIVLPTMLFGGQTWYKRLGWITILLGVFSLLFVYPSIAAVVGIIQRLIEGRYSRWPYSSDIFHALLSLLTLALHAWTALITLRAARLVRKLSHGEFGTMQVTVR